MAIGASVGASIGSACGSASGIVGLKQVCNINPKIDCSSIIDAEKNNAAEWGALVGAAVGGAIGAVAYPVYKGFVGWCYPDYRNQRNQVENNDNLTNSRANLLSNI